MKKILIVEDEQLISYFMETYVSDSGCSVVIATTDNGDDAIEIVIFLSFILRVIRIIKPPNVSKRRI